MKRDMDLVRTILICMSENDDPDTILWANVAPGYTLQQIFHHAHLMRQGGLIFAADKTYSEDVLPTALPLSITWDGHEFLDSVRDSTVWEKAKKYVLKPTGGVATSVLTDWLKTQATAALALVQLPA